METLANLECFVRSAELKSFSEAARRLALTPAAVSRNVAKLETNLGVRLFQRSTRRLTLTGDGERFLKDISGGLQSIQSAIGAISQQDGQPSGTLKVSISPGFGADYVLPLLRGFVRRYPGIHHDWHLDNRKVDLIADGFDAAISAGIELTPGVVARELCRVHMIVVAAPAYLEARKVPRSPSDLSEWDWIAMRSVQTGKLRQRRLCSRTGREIEIATPARLVFNDPEAVSRGAVMGLGVALVSMPHALPHLESGRLKRVLPNWFWDDGPFSLYYPGQRLIAAKARAFIDFIMTEFEEAKIADRLLAV